MQAAQNQFVQWNPPFSYSSRFAYSAIFTSNCTLWVLRNPVLVLVVKGSFFSKTLLFIGFWKVLAVKASLVSGKPLEQLGVCIYIYI